MWTPSPRPLGAAIGCERRHYDRRRAPTPMLSRYTLHGGQRRGCRRADDDRAAFVDLYGPGLFLAVMVVVTLNLLDAWFTLLFLSQGGRELNPFVQRVLEMGPVPFVVFKTFGIGLCAAFLALTKNFRAARIGLWVVIVGYSLLLCWHLTLLHQIEG